MKIHLVLTDDWELRGDGSGNMGAIQFKTINTLTEILEEYGLRGSFYAEVMQQLYHKKFGKHFPYLNELAENWEAIVQKVFKRGHDIQLHIHSQWHNADYQNGKWKLNSDWSIINHPVDVIQKLISECKNYLESVLGRVDNDYKCVAFRAGFWTIAPNKHILSILAKNGIIFDTSIVNDLVYDYSFKPVMFDYRNLDEKSLPYYPVMYDARKMSDSESPIVCVPTHSFYARNKIIPATIKILRSVSRNGDIWNKFNSYIEPNAIPIIDAGYNINEYSRIKEKRFDHLKRKLRPFFVAINRTSDLSSLNYPLMMQMIKDIRKKAKSSRMELVPIVIANHTKVIGNFQSLKKFAKFLSNASDIEVITLSELGSNIRKGLYTIKKKEITTESNN